VGTEQIERGEGESEEESIKRVEKHFLGFLTSF
jgi:hypothetical protein